MVPWQAWYAGLGGDPLKPTEKFEYNVMFFFGLEAFGEDVHPDVGAHQDQQGRQRRCSRTTLTAMLSGTVFPPQIKAAGYTPIDGGAYPDGTANFTTMIDQFKSDHCEVYVNCPLPPDFNTFWKQAAQQGFKPKIATVAKVLLFPADVKALGSLVNNVATDAWWSPFAPYKSALTGQTAAQLATEYQRTTGQQWTQAIGSTYAAFEVAHNALKTASDPHDHQDVADKLHSMKYEGMNGTVDFASGPTPVWRSSLPPAYNGSLGNQGRSRTSLMRCTSWIIPTLPAGP